KFVNEANKISPRAREAIFTPEAARTLNNLDTLRRGDRHFLQTPKQRERSLTGLLERNVQVVDKIFTNVKDLGFVVVAKALGQFDDAVKAGKNFGVQPLLADPKVG